MILDDQDQEQEHATDGPCQSYAKDYVGAHVLCFLRDQFDMELQLQLIINLNIENSMICIM